MATKVNKLAKEAMLKANMSVCASLLLAIPSRCWNAGPSEAARTAGQHQAPISAGMERAAMQLEPKMDANSSFLGIRPSSTSPNSGEPSPQDPSCQPPP